MASYERLGAELERRWADLADPDAPRGEARSAELVVGHTRQGAKQTSGLMMQLADTLDKSAELAEEHALRSEEAGQSDGAARERQAAERARDAAQRARSQAEQWLKLAGGPAKSSKG